MRVSWLRGRKDSGGVSGIGNYRHPVYMKGAEGGGRRAEGGGRTADGGGPRDIGTSVLPADQHIKVQRSCLTEPTAVGLHMPLTSCNELHGVLIQELPVIRPIVFG